MLCVGCGAAGAWAAHGCSINSSIPQFWLRSAHLIAERNQNQLLPLARQLAPAAVVQCVMWQPCRWAAVWRGLLCWAEWRSAAGTSCMYFGRCARPLCLEGAGVCTVRVHRCMRAAMDVQSCHMSMLARPSMAWQVGAGCGAGTCCTPVLPALPHQ
ncbi:hypothetical protein COO60DRAFT_322932 [Scenedesmus sp. NREL 46B-D3]|nr:hypothetical protein COO60DRAFT_322932 [Scenedesmus sp. NREL 46B-D3]